MTNTNQCAKTDYDAVVGEFLQSRVSELLPARFWEDDCLKGFHTDRNMLLDLYGKHKQDNFTVADMFRVMCDENRTLIELAQKGLPQAFLSKSADTLYWLAYLGNSSGRDSPAARFCGLKTKGYFEYLYRETQNHAYRSGFSDLLCFNDDCIGYSENTCYLGADYLGCETVDTIGNALRLICKVLNIDLKEPYQGEEEIRLRTELIGKAREMLSRIFLAIGSSA